QEPVRLVPEVYIGNVEFNVLCAQGNHGALHPRSRIGADEMVSMSHGEFSLLAGGRSGAEATASGNDIVFAPMAQAGGSASVAGCRCMR
ncbi:MAG: hypothetical protein KDJ29_07075, partial [Hyphomicrobiales bacterium]|nr:hypothetical protein [Hyphomicrobiales bacterium]